LDKLWSLKRSIQQLPDDQWVVCTDGYDCLYLRSIEEIIAQLQNFGTGIIFSSQTEPDHHSKFAIDYFRTRYGTAHYPILNSGIIAGRVQDLNRMISRIQQWDLKQEEMEFRKSMAGIGNFNDQTLCGLYAARFPDETIVDSQAQLSWTSAYENDIVNSAIRQNGGLFQNPKSGTFPCIFHLPYTTPDVYLQYLSVYIANFDTLLASDADLVRIDRLLSKGGAIRQDGERVLEVLQKDPNYLSSRKQQFARNRNKTIHMTVSKLVRLLFPRGTGLGT
jgi:hypothetical protein